MSRTALNPLDGLARLGRAVAKASRLLEETAVLTPAEATRLTRVPLEDLPETFRPVVLKTWPVRTKAGVVTKQRLGYRLADCHAHVSGRLLTGVRR